MQHTLQEKTFGESPEKQRKCIMGRQKNSRRCSLWRDCSGTSPLRPKQFIFRMEALARLLEEHVVPGWTLPKTEDGAIPTQKEVFSAAAVEPLTKIRDDIGFEYEPFLRRVLAEAEAEGNA